MLGIQVAKTTKGAEMSRDLGVYNIWDIRREAKKRLPKGIFEYIDRGAEDEIALRNNRAAFDKLKFVNRVLVDVSKRKLNYGFLGKPISMPFGISPTGTVGLTRYGGEVAVAQAAERMGIPCCVSTNAQTKMEEIWEKAGGNLWFQLYMWPDVSMRMNFIDRVRSVGFDTLVVTVDGPVGSNREYNKRNGYGIPLKPNPRMIAQFLAKPGWLFSVIVQHYIRRGPLVFENYPPELRSRVTDRKQKYKLAKTDNQNWTDIKLIRDKWHGKLILKGLLNKTDVLRAVKAGVDAVIISNHGGRYIDSSVAPIEVLPEIRNAIGDDFPLIVDSGPRRGSDIIKALALGANLVMSGRPTLYGAAFNGEEGAYRVLEILREETDTLMAQLGLNSIDEIGPQIFWSDPD